MINGKALSIKTDGRQIPPLVSNYVSSVGAYAIWSCAVELRTYSTTE